MSSLREKLERMRQDIDMRQERVEPTRREAAIFALIDVALAADELEERCHPAVARALERLERGMG